MFDKVLVPTDGSDFSNKAVEAAIEYCRRMGSPMTVLYVMPRSPGVSTMLFGDYAEKVREQNELHGKQVLQQAAERAAAQGVTCDTTLMSDDQPHRAIVKAAEQDRCALVFMASHGRSGIEEALLGSQTQKVLAYSKVPVLVFR